MSTVTVVATVEPSTGPYDPPRVRLDVTDSGTPAVSATTVTRLDPDGRTVPVRTLDGGPLRLQAFGADRVGLLYDYEAPLGQPVVYSTLESPAVVTGQVTLPADDVWLIHPGVPELSLAVDLRAESFAEEEWAVTQGVHWPMGREHPVVQTDGQRKAPSSSLTVRVHTSEQLQSLRTLLADAGTLQLNVPAQLGIGVDTCYVAVGAVTNRRLVNIGDDPRRSVVLPYQVVTRPEGGSQSERTYTDVLASFASYAAVQAAYDSYADLLAGP